jgi:wyosine [tRNA(Phe)-imidazoG37] synthetase (radical SAM superfamily)
LGGTTDNTLNRKEYVPVAEVKSEIQEWVEDGGKADYVTLSGSGEPTLHTRFGDILRFIRERTPFPAALLSNGTLFFLPEVREAAHHADVVKLSLSVWDQFSFDHINSPHPGLQLHKIIEGHRAFRETFCGKLWIEVFLLRGMNTAQHHIEEIAKLVESISPDETHLNTVVRPPAEDFARAVPRKQMEALAGLFRPRAKVIAEFPSDKSADVAANEGTILAMLRRRPCTAKQIAEVFGMHLNEVSKYVGKLSRTGKIRAQGRGREAYFVAVGTGGG